MIDLAELDEPLVAAPRFLVEPPDASPSAETPRQTTFLRDMRKLAPTVLVFANANAGKRARTTARKEGIRSGVFDLTCVWNRGIAYVEFKGRDARGRAGALSQNQISFGNALVERGMHCACFFNPVSAIEWLRSLGAPVREVRR